MDFPLVFFYQALGFLFFPPLVIILPLFFSNSNSWLVFSPRLSTFCSLSYASALGFPLLLALGLNFNFSSLVYNISHPCFFTFSTLGHYSALVFFFLPPLIIILPLVISFSIPWLLFFSLGFPPFGATSQYLFFYFYPPLAVIQPCIQQVRVPDFHSTFVTNLTLKSTLLDF